MTVKGGQVAPAPQWGDGSALVLITLKHGAKNVVKKAVRLGVSVVGWEVDSEASGRGKRSSRGDVGVRIMSVG